MEPDVVIVGGGPVGLMLAAELRLWGIETLLLERLAEPTGQSRAFRLQPSTLEVFDQRGIFDALRQDNKIWGYAHFAGLRPLLDLGKLDTAHPYALLMPQAKTEAALERRALDLGATIRRGHEVTGLTADADGVTVDVTGPDGEYRLRTSYLVGCDGGRSTIRHLTGVAFPGSEPGVTARLADVDMPAPGAVPFDLPATLRTERGTLMAVSVEPGKLRVVTTEYGQPMPPRDVPLTEEEFRDSIRRIYGQDVDFGTPRWLARFHDAARVVASYRTGRVFLAGDAAHIHFPVGAQGLNLGLLDAVNLGWKLAGTIQGWAAPDLLDSYDTERRPVAEQAILETRAQTELMNPDPALDPLRRFVGMMLAVPEANRMVCEVTSGLAVRYDLGTGDGEAHPLVGRRVPEIDLGERRLVTYLHGGRAVLLIPAERDDLATVAASWSDRVDVVTGSGGYDGVDALLVRPDGYVAWVAPGDGKPQQDVDGLDGALRRWFGAPVEAARE